MQSFESVISTSQSIDFLRTIRWAKEADRSWVEKVDNVTWIVELGLGGAGFGDPDIILICEGAGIKSHFIFLL